MLARVMSVVELGKQLKEMIQCRQLFLDGRKILYLAKMIHFYQVAFIFKIFWARNVFLKFTGVLN